jgi:small subunit ribosomal protein S11
VAATQAAKNAMNMGLKSVIVRVNGTGQGKDTAIRSLATAGLAITEIADVTPIPHNGCRPPKKPR